MAEVVGVDGWRGGWAVAVADGRRLTWSSADDFAAVLDAHGGRPVAVDMPIGLTDGPRDCDLAARRWLGEHHGPWQSIFLAPTRAVAAAFEGDLTHAEAMARRGASAGTSIQAWNLLAKTIEVRDALACRPGHAVVEAHPECSFRALDDTIGMASKKTAIGVGRRLRALRGEFDLPDLAAAPDGVPVDDLLDAAVLAWTARRFAHAEVTILGADASRPPRIVI